MKDAHNAGENGEEEYAKGEDSLRLHVQIA